MRLSTYSSAEGPGIRTLAAELCLERISHAVLVERVVGKGNGVVRGPIAGVDLACVDRVIHLQIRIR